MVPELKVGDIIFQNKDGFGYAMVRFLMTAPTVWHHIYRAITKTQISCEFYHPVIVISETQSAEQQKEVQYDDLEDELGYKQLLIVRRKNITNEQLEDLVDVVESEIGMPWGVLNTIGKFLTWLSGIKLFGRYIKTKDEEVSALRIARWYYKVFGEKFGEKHYSDNTTQTMVQYCLNNPDKYEVVYKKG